MGVVCQVVGTPAMDDMVTSVTESDRRIFQRFLRFKGPTPFPLTAAQTFSPLSLFSDGTHYYNRTVLQSKFLDFDVLVHVVAHDTKIWPFVIGVQLSVISASNVRYLLQSPLYLGLIIAVIYIPSSLFMTMTTCKYDT